MVLASPAHSPALQHSVAALLRCCAECWLRRNEGGPLSFYLNGEDLTKQTQVLTQEAIDQHLAAALLPKTVFHSRGESSNLLEVGTAALGQCRFGLPMGFTHAWHSACASSCLLTRQCRIHTQALLHICLSRDQDHPCLIMSCNVLNKKETLTWHLARSKKQD